MPAYHVTMKRTSSTTLAVGAITGAASATRRAAIFGLVLGSEATPANVAIDWQIQRCQGAGTAGSAPTITQDDLADAAATMVIGQALSANPATILAGLCWDIPLNQQGTWIWECDQASANAKKSPATSTFGFVILTPTINASGTPIITASARWGE